MQIQLISEPNENLSPLKQVLLNRGIEKEVLPSYINHKDEDINSPLAFGEDLMRAGARLLANCIQTNGIVYVIVDPDVDGMTSSAILINYLYKVFPAFVENNLVHLFHEGKSHGIDEFIDDLLKMDFKLLICPDSASNDLDSIEKLHEQNKDVLILDHHEAEELSPYAITINSQYNYPNPTLSGAGVVYQFCKYLDKILNVSYADEFLDLVAVGLQSDMMDLRNLETKELIFKGFQKDKITNPLIYGLSKKNEFALHKADYIPSENNDLEITPIGCSFFITPLLNAICRSGTQAEKELIFESMLTHLAFEQILSTKKGHKLGEKERKVDQALRVCTNVKNRQTKFEENAIQILEQKIEKENLLEHKVLLFLLDKNTDIPAEVRGLIANKFMAKYQRPCAVLSYVPALPWEEQAEDVYAGSMRGYERTGIKNFKDICAGARGTIYAMGHQSAAGLAIAADKIEEFLADTDAALESVSAEPIYYVDYLFNGYDVDEDILIQLADVNDYIGTGIERPYVAVKNLKVYGNMLTMMKSNTLKISLPNGVSIIKFGCEEEEFNNLYSENGCVEINLVAKPNKNVWNYNISGQLLIEDYEIIGGCAYVF